VMGWGGVRLEWEQFGPDNAPAILLAHGWSLTHDAFYYQKLALAGEFRVLVWDMRGMGRSASPADNDYSMNALLQDFAAVFDATEAGRHPAGCLLAGHSLGAMLLPLFAEAFPDRMTAVRGLALMAGTDSPLLASMRGRRWLVPCQKWFWEPLARLMGRCPWPFAAFARLIWQVGAVHLAAMYTLHRGRESRGQIDLIAFHCATVSMRAAGLGAISCFQFDARRAMTEITVPTLLLTGECDVNMPPEIQRAMVARLMRPELILIPGCGHQNILECHAEVNAQLRDFAKRCFAKM
jgi:pimeloyl-ACP methyl ester carboxylesterase